MTTAEFQNLSPLAILGGGALVTMLVASFRQGHGLAAVLSITVLASAFASLFAIGPRPEGRIVEMDGPAVFYGGLIIASAIFVAVLSHGYLSKFELKAEEFHMLLLLATLGACTVAASNHFAGFFLGLELLSVSLYVMIAYVFRRETSMEAAVKYLVLAAAASAFLVFGMALVYAATGTMEFASLRAILPRMLSDGEPAALAGTTLILCGIGFKLSAAPFHWWAPDVYQGAPAPVGAFVATASKGAVIALLFRLPGDAAAFRGAPLLSVVVFVCVASMTLGNLLALRQGNLKRLLAYSSIAHMGYVLVAFIAGGDEGAQAAAFYMAAYAAATIAAFGLLGAVSGRDGEPEEIVRWEGVFRTRPWLGAGLAVSLLSLIGLPMTAGFWGKILVIASGLRAGLWMLVVLLAVNSALGVYYYLRVLAAACRTSGDAVSLPAPGRIASAVLVLAAAFTILAGLWPGPLLDLIANLLGGDGV